jgi:hypothetical protein
MHTITGQGKKNVKQDTIIQFELKEESLPVRCFGVLDGHGDFGREVITYYKYIIFIGIINSKCRYRSWNKEEYKIDIEMEGDERL